MKIKRNNIYIYFTLAVKTRLFWKHREYFLKVYFFKAVKKIFNGNIQNICIAMNLCSKKKGKDPSKVVLLCRGEKCKVSQNEIASCFKNQF